MSGARITIAAVDDDRMLLDGLQSWMARLPDVELAGTFTSLADFLDAGATVDVVLLDLNLRNLSSPPENVRRLRAAGAEVLVVSTIPDAEHVLACLEAGAAGYITKDNDLDALAEAVRQVAAGVPVVSRELAFIMSTDRRPQRPQLSPQERAVLLAYAQGRTLEAAARRAGVAYGTAREYLERVKRKYTATGRPTSTKFDLVNRVREDRLELDGLPAPGNDPSS